MYTVKPEVITMLLTFSKIPSSTIISEQKITTKYICLTLQVLPNTLRHFINLKGINSFIIIVGRAIPD